MTSAASRPPPVVHCLMSIVWMNFCHCSLAGLPERTMRRNLEIDNRKWAMDNLGTAAKWETTPARGTDGVLRDGFCFDDLDGGADGREFVGHLRVSAFDIADTADVAHPVGHQRRNDIGEAGAQIRNHHVLALQA